MPELSCHLLAVRIHQFTKSPIALFSTLRFILIRANDVFGYGDGIVGQSFLVDALPVRVALLLVGRAIAFDRTFVDVVVARHLPRHRSHVSLLASGQLR